MDKRAVLGHLTDSSHVLHTTDATGPYLSLWARVPDFQREMLEEALCEQRASVKFRGKL